MFINVCRAQSVQINKAKLQVLQARDNVLDEVFEETKKVLKETAKSPSYQELLNDLVLQCFFRLGDEKVTITYREADESMVETAIHHATKEYLKASGKRVVASLDSHHLAADCAGGVIGSSLNGRIKCDNTLEMRLEQAFELMLPEMRVSLFGPSPNRKFFD